MAHVIFCAGGREAAALAEATGCEAVTSIRRDEEWERFSGLLKSRAIIAVPLRSFAMGWRGIDGTTYSFTMQCLAAYPEHTPEHRQALMRIPVPKHAGPMSPEEWQRFNRR